MPDLTSFVERLEAYASANNLAFWLSGVDDITNAPNIAAILIQYPRDAAYMNPTDAWNGQIRLKTEAFLTEAWSASVDEDVPSILEIHNPNDVDELLKVAHQIGQLRCDDLIWIARELESHAAEHDVNFYLMDTSNLGQAPEDGILRVIPETGDFVKACKFLTDLAFQSGIRIHPQTTHDMAPSVLVMLKERSFRIGTSERFKPEPPSLPRDLVEFGRTLGIISRGKGGRYILMDVNSLDDRPPQDQMWVVVDFEEQDDEAARMANVVGSAIGLPVRTSKFAEMDEEFLITMSHRGRTVVIGDRPQFARLVSEHPRLSRPLLHGWEIGIGWVGLVGQYGEVADRVIPDDVRFEVRQIKEKFGGLRISGRPVRAGEDEEVSDFYALDADLATKPEPRQLEDWEKALRDARILAEQRSFYVCEKCGQPGRLRNQDGWFFTACDAHATDKDGRIAEIVEKSTVIRVDGKRLRYDREKDDMVEIALTKLETVEGLDDHQVRAIRRYIEEQLEIVDFTVIAAVKKLEHGWEGAMYATIIQMVDGEVRLVETEAYGSDIPLTEERLQEQIEMYRELADQTEVLLEKYRELKEARHGVETEE